jgi:type 1 fimbria pilin
MTHLENKALPLLLAGVIAFLLPSWLVQATINTLNTLQTPPVSVVFGVHSLAPATPVNSRVAFISQNITLPEVVCSHCGGDGTRWESAWLVSPGNGLNDETAQDTGWYVFASGVEGIGIGIQTDVNNPAGHSNEGQGNRLPLSGALNIGLVRLQHDNGAGLATLLPARFKRITVFYDDAHRALYTQEDTVQVSANLNVPTCTSQAGNLSFKLPDIGQVFLKNSLAAGDYSELLFSPPQQVVTNCSNNTRHLRIRFMPSGSVTDSVLGADTILVGHDASGQETGVGYVMKYDAQGFGRQRQGVVQWNSQLPLVLINPAPGGDGNSLPQSITVSLQAYYARPKNTKAVVAGEIVAKGMYQVSYD